MIFTSTLMVWRATKKLFDVELLANRTRTDRLEKRVEKLEQA